MLKKSKKLAYVKTNDIYEPIEKLNQNVSF